MAGRIFQWKFEGREEDYVSVRAFLKSKRFPNSLLSSLKAVPDAVLSDGRPVHMNALLSGGEEIRVMLPEETLSDKICPERIPLSVLYEVADILVIDKPPGMPVHSSAGHIRGTLANAAAFHYEAQREMRAQERKENERLREMRETGEEVQQESGLSGALPGGGAFSGWDRYVPSFHCLNRLDRDTTGVIVIAKNRLAAANLGEAAERREVHREYLAVVTGCTAGHGVIEAPIRRVKGSVILRECAADGQSALTEFCRTGIYRAEDGADAGQIYSILKIRLGTGRTHQIRVHMKAAGFPLPGDYLYNPDYRRIGRQPLHSLRMSFLHPVSGERVTFSAPVPADMREAFGAGAAYWDDEGREMDGP